MDRLRQVTRPHHNRAEQIPLMNALLTGAVARDDYVRYLRMLAIVHASLERQLQSSEDSTVKQVWHRSMCRAPFLMQDLEALDACRIPDSQPATEKALALVDWMMLLKAEQPIGLLGCLYVLEGSRHGARLLVDPLRDALEIDGGTGLSYFAEGARDMASAWDAFSRRMNEALADESACEAVMAGAQQMFDKLAEVLIRVWPAPSRLKYLATTINPEAGRHRIPNDAQTLEAVFAATRQCWDAYPYFAQRFPERGLRFGFSDCGWLAALEELPAESVTEQVVWMSKVLSARGIPSVLLEAQLHMLYEALMNHRPDRAADHDKLRSAAERLAAGRASVIEPNQAEALAARFQDHIAEHPAFPLPDMGRILVAAVCDEARGSDRAVTSILGWARTAGQWPEPHLQAAQAAVDAARTAAQRPSA